MGVLSYFDIGVSRFRMQISRLGSTSPVIKQHYMQRLYAGPPF